MSEKDGHGLSRRRYAAYVCLLIVSCVLLYFFAFRGMRFFLVPSSSMEPTLLPGDRLVTLKESAYQPGDIVVMRDPEDPEAFIVKRIVATEKTTVEIRSGGLFINGHYASEPYAKEQIFYEMKPFTVGNNEVFVLGDNRNESEDSSFWGKGLPVGSIVGKVVYIYYPFDRAGFVPSYPLQAITSLGRP